MLTFACFNLIALTGNLVYMTYVFVRYIHGLQIKNKMVRSFYALAFCMTVLYSIFQINQVVTGGTATLDEVYANDFNVRNGSLSLAKLFDFLLSLQIDYTMLKLSLSIKVNNDEITYCDKIQRKSKF